MLTEKLFDKILVEPIKKGANELYIVSGYGTSAMAFHHLEIALPLAEDIKVRLIVGMCPQDGLAASNYRGFLKISEDFPGNFECSYVAKPPPVHAKMYAWFGGGGPVCGYAGSANYTQRAFGERQRELMTSCDPEKAKAYYESLASDTIYCTHDEAENVVKIGHDKYFRKEERGKIEEAAPGVLASLAPDINELRSVRVSLLARYGKLPQRSGLNWGQRPEEGREPNQAYLRLPADVYNSDFFPERTVHFTILTDDNKVLVCTRAQDNGKAIHTPHNNSLIGEYFRNRLGVASGAPVQVADLNRYGRSHVDFYKIDDETYYMDFSV